MTVYIEYVLINNFILDYLLLKATFLITGNRPPKKRLLFCAFLASVFALFYPLLSFSGFLLTSIKIAFGFLMVIISANYRSVREYLINCLVFFSLTFLTGGALLGVYSLLNVNLQNSLVFAISVVLAWLIIKMAVALNTYQKNKKLCSQFEYEVEISVNDKTQRVKGFLDTGNALFDGQTPCVVCNLRLAKKFITEKLPQMGRVTVGTVNAVESKLAIKNARLKIYTADMPNIISNVTLVVSDCALGEFDILLHPALFKEDYERSITNPLKKIS